MIFANEKDRVSILKGVVIRKIILYAAFMRFLFKIHTLVQSFESSTPTKILIRHKCCKKVTG